MEEHRIEPLSAVAPDDDADVAAPDALTVSIDYRSRPQFEAFHHRVERFACIVAHRRAGKTVACVHDLQRGALQCDKLRPRFAYLSPFLRQSKQVAWDYLRAAMAPSRLIGASAHETELRVDYPNGGQVRLFGADNPDALRGIYLDGVVLDEYADMDPRVWSEIIRPALADRQGWAVFIGTPKGRNAFFELWRRAQSEPDWFALMLKASETGLIAPEELALARRDLSEAQYAQEFECSFDAAVVGAYYGALMRQAEADGRIAGVPYDPVALVWTAWDLGIRDATAIWFAQIVGREIRIIDYYEASGVDLGHYARELMAKPYAYAGHIVPHDAQAKELGTGKSRLEVLAGLGLKGITLAPMHRIEDGINAVRVVIPRCWFDTRKCARGIDALRLYRAEHDDKHAILRPHPVHDWTSHAADAFRYLAMTLDRQAGTTGFHRRIDYPEHGVV
jgi:phage terminase large subunit